MTSDSRDKSQRYSIPHVIDLRAYNSRIEETSDQIDPSYFDVARYLPPGIQVNLVEKGGALFVPHRLNEFAIKVVRKKVDLVVFQCMLRYTLGFHRPVARLSNGFIGTWTGLQTPNVRKGIRSLKEMGLVKVLVPGTASSTALYEVPIVRGYLDWRRDRENEAKRDSTAAPNQAEIQSISDTNNPRPAGTGINEIPIQEQIKSGPDSARSPRKKFERKENLSPLENLPHRITNFIASIRPHQKRVEEEYHLHQLLMDYPVDDIVEALDHIQTHGALDTGERVHSPFKYLSYTCEEVISAIAKEKERAMRREESRRRVEDEQIAHEQKRAAETREMTDALAAFAALDASEQKRHIVEFKQAHYGTHGMEPPEHVTHNLAAVHWFSSKREQG